ncbi:MAG: DUF305 domain-containing protein [Singulisphaera sp.]
MQKRHAFWPESLGPLEDRLVLSRMTMGPAQVASPSTVRASRSTSDRMTTQFEINFLTGMIPHHQMAIRMSQIALRNSDNPEVRDLARRIISEQRPEIQQMQRFLAHNGVRGYQPTTTPDEQAVLQELRSLRGTEFDRAFLTEMTGHHQAAISGEHGMVGASECLDRAAQPGLRQLCSNIVSTQTREIQEMQTLLGEAVGMPTDHGGMGGHSG